jgi:D-alanyl-D-alanine carboxypeptidase
MVTRRELLTIALGALPTVGGAGAGVEVSFRAGSVTRMFVATVVLQLAGENRLALDDTLARWVPGAPSYGDRVTVRHLLQHTSGIDDYAKSAGFTALYHADGGIDRMRYRTWEPPDLIALVGDRPPLWEAGAAFRYSSTNYLLLGMLVEKVTGRNWAAEAGRRILRPLGLRHTRLPGTEASMAGPHLHGYAPGKVDVSVYNPSVAGAAGEMVTTATDVGTFLAALIRGRLLRPAELRQMLTVRPGRLDYEYGLGLMTRTLPGGTRLWGHRGNFLDAYFTEAWTNGDRQVTLAVTPRDSVYPADAITSALRAAFDDPPVGVAGGEPVAGQSSPRVVDRRDARMRSQSWVRLAPITGR